MSYTLVPTELIVDGAITSAKLDTNIAISGTLGVTGEVTLATHLIMGDNDKIKIGTGGDLEIYHDGSNSYISNSTGNIYLADTNGAVHIQAKLNEESIVASADGAVTLYHDNSAKLATASGGVTVTGTLTATTLAGTLSTAAQPNITSVGTLTGFTSTGIDDNADATAITIDSSERVGIGTGASIDAPLHIQYTGTGSGLVLESTEAGASNAPDLVLYRNSSSPADSDDIGNILFRGKDDAGNDNSYAFIMAEIGDASNGSEDGNLFFRTQSGGSLDNRLSIVSNNIGIGTDSPTSFLTNATALEISGGTGVGSELILTNNSSMSANEVVGSLIFKNTDGSGSPNHFAGLRAKAESTYGRMFLEFYAGRSRMEGGTPDMIISPSGADAQANVGIGNTSPTEKLAVHGAIQSSSTGNFNGGTEGVFIDYNSSTGIGKIQSASWGTAYKTLDLQAVTHVFSTGSGSAAERMRIDTNGKLLINNTSNVENGIVQVFGTKALVAGIPQGLLQVSDKQSQAAGIGGGINFTGAYLDNGTHTSFASIEASKTNGTSGNYGGDLVFKTRVHGGSQLERMRIDSSGRVGLGLQITSNQASTYDSRVNDFVVSGGGDTGITIAGGSSEDIRISFTANGTTGLSKGSITYDNNADSMAFETAGTERMRITSSGFTKHSNTGAYDTYSYADDSHQFVSDNASHSTLWVTNTNTNYATGMLRLESARGASSAFNFLAATTGNLTDDQFLLRGDGNAYADGSWNGGGADYAEYFEWSDGNTGNEDRRGYTVVLSENKIRKSTSEDNTNNIIGVVSGNPSVIGDSDIGAWKNKYQKDDYGSYIKDENGDRVINNEYDETQDYISREDRQEWDIIGLMGKVRINKGQTVGDRWIKMRDISDTIEEWLIK